MTVYEAPLGRIHPDLGGRDLFHSRVPFPISPFLVVSDFRMTGPVFPPHPHAGFSVATYILPESETGFWNQDTLGTVNRIPPGALHWSTAGAGLMHEETVMRRGRAALGLQIWVDHPADMREIPPAALHLPAADVPVSQDGGLLRRQVLGHGGGLTSPLGTPVPVGLADIAAEPGVQWEETLPDGHAGWFLVHDGAILTGGETVPAGWAAPVGGALQAGPRGARLFIFSGRPTTARPLHSGPFVGSDKAMLDRFEARYQAGDMGRLTPFDQTGLDRMAE